MKLAIYFELLFKNGAIMVYIKQIRKVRRRVGKGRSRWNKR